MSLIDYLNIAYLDLYTADGGVLVGNELSVRLAHADPIDREQLHVWDWTGVDITREVSAGPLGMSVHDHVKARLAGEDDEVVFSDHGSGEIADFVALRREAETLTFTLYHCKGSEEAFPGARVIDVYEVCGQAQKSVVWRRLDLIRRRLDPRLDQLAFVRGTAEQLSALLTQAEALRQLFQIVVVQPGISAGGITTPLLENLGATSAHLTRAGFQRLRVAVSA